MPDHTIRYRLLGSHNDDGIDCRDVDVHATPEELTHLAEQGYLVRESHFTGAALQQLRAACDRIEERELGPRKPGTPGRRSWGFIPRYLEDKEPAFFDLIDHAPVVSIARAMMGPRVRLRGLSARITWAGEETHDTPWHHHLRVLCDPRPPWYSEPHALDALIYLDDLDDTTGPICIVPGSHLRLEEPPRGCHESIPDQICLRVPAGTIILIHGNLWHRALPTVSAKRRMLILSYTPCWLRRGPYGTKPDHGLTDDALPTASQELKELLGHAGHS